MHRLNPGLLSPRVRFACALVAGVFVAAVGCEKQTGPVLENTRVRAISQTGAQHYLSAMQLWAQSYTAADEERDAREQLRECVARLRAAIETDPECALFYSKLADVIVANDPLRLDEAEALYNRSIDEVRAWVPGYIGLARIQYMRALADPDNWQSFREKGEHYALVASRHLHLLESYEPGPPPPKPILFGLLGSTQPKDERPRPGDPRIEKDARFAILMDMAYAHDAWRLDNPGALMGQTAADGAVNDRGNVLVRRLRAQIEMQRIRLAFPPGQVLEDPEVQFQNFIRWTRDDFELSMEMASLYRQRGDRFGDHREYQAAEGLLVNWANPNQQGNKMLAGYPPLFRELLRIYTGWVKIATDDGPRHVALESSGKVLERLRVIAGKEPASELLFVDAVASVAERSGSKEYANRVVAWCDEINQMAGADRAAVERVRGRAQAILAQHPSQGGER